MSGQKKFEQWRSIFYDEGTGGARKRTKAPWREQTGGLRPSRQNLRQRCDLYQNSLEKAYVFYEKSPEKVRQAVAVFFILVPSEMAQNHINFSMH